MSNENFKANMVKVSRATSTEYRLRFFTRKKGFQPVETLSVDIPYEVYNEIRSGKALAQENAS